MNTAETVAKILDTLQNEKKIYGIKGLAEYLNCSYPTASRIARSGIFPRYQVPKTRQIFFKEDEILAGMNNERA